MNLTDEDRARIARGWRDSGLAQGDYAQKYGVTDRALRTWIARWAPARPASIEDLQAEVNRIIAEMRGLVAELVRLTPSVIANSALSPARRGPVPVSAAPPGTLDLSNVVTNG